MISYKPWRLDQVLLLGIRLCASVLVGIGVIQLAHYYVPLQNTTGEQTLALTVGMLSFHGAALILIWMFLREHHAGVKQSFGFRQEGMWNSISIGILGGVIALPIALGLGQMCEWAMRSVEIEPVAQQTVQTIQSSGSPVLKGFFGAVAICVAPPVEEMLFRGIIYPTIKQLGFPKMALIGSSILFAASHANLLTTIPLFFLSLMLTLLYERTDNLLAPIAAHSLFNAVNFFFLIRSQFER